MKTAKLADRELDNVCTETMRMFSSFELWGISAAVSTYNEVGYIYVLYEGVQTKWTADSYRQH